MEELAKTFQKHLCHGDYMTTHNIHQITRVVNISATISNGAFREQLSDKIWWQEALYYKLEITVS